MADALLSSCAAVLMVAWQLCKLSQGCQASLVAEDQALQGPGRVGVEDSLDRVEPLYPFASLL